MKLTEEDVNRLSKASKEYGEMEGKFIDRIDEIFTLLFEFFNQSRKNWYWYFDGAEEGEVGDLLAINYNSDNEITVVSGDGDTYDMYQFDKGFPVKFLFMSYKEIKLYLNTFTECMKEEAKKEIQKKAKQRATERKAIAQEAIKKLSKEERKALGLK